MAFAKPAEYFDLGSFQAWLFMDWSTSTINKDHLNTYLDSFAEQLLEQGLSHVILSFGQVCDIPKIIEGDYSNLSQGDSLGMLQKNVDGSKMGGPGLFKYMISRWLSNGVTTGFAFGGINASETDWDFGFKSHSTNSLATDLAAWAKDLGIVQLDFDVENAAFANNDAQGLAQFFESLRTSFSSPVTLTVMGDINAWGLEGKVFSPMFQYGRFQDLFDGINLMLYNGQYYLNAGQTPIQSWDLISWQKQIMTSSEFSAETAAAYLNVGFNAKIDYTLAASSGGPLPYTTLPAGISSGGAARYILEKLEDGVGSSLGPSFFWDSNADYTVSATNEYKSMFFFSTGDFEKSFFS